MKRPFLGAESEGVDTGSASIYAGWKDFDEGDNARSPPTLSQWFKARR